MLDATIDFETFYSTEFSLGKIRGINYIRDPQFKAHGMCLKIGEGPSLWVSHDDIPDALSDLQRQAGSAGTRVVGHNLLFDGLILVEHYGFRATRWTDTMYMALAMLPDIKNHKLDTIAKLLGVGGKIDGLAATKGIRDLPPEIEQELATYAIQDGDITYAVDQILYPMFPESERELMHMITRMGVDALLHLDVEKTILGAERLNEVRLATIAAAGVEVETLSSNDQFALHLQGLGVEVPTKISPRTNQPTWALAQGDIEYVNMVRDHGEHDLLWKARKAAKSNNERRRMEALTEIGQTPQGTLPMPYRYYGAHTGRLSGTGGINVQNLNRGSDLRRAIQAPKDHLILVADLSQIELRMNLWLCGQNNLLQALREGKDLYSVAAAETFGLTYEDVRGGYEGGDPEMTNKRQFGKMLELALGFNMGSNRFQNQLAVGFLGADPIYLSSQEAQEMVGRYRETHPHIVNMWKRLQSAIGNLISGQELKIGPVTFGYEVIHLPNGMPLLYPSLYGDETGNFWYGRHKKLYGGLLLENIVQALARIVMTDAMLSLDKHAPIVGTVHDELLQVVPESEVEQHIQRAESVMKTPPSWAPDLPLDVDIKYGYVYEK